MLIWDGLQLHIPQAMQPATLNRGFIRLFGPDLPSVEFRFAPERNPFDARKDGRRLLDAAGLSKETIEPCSEPWARGLPGNLYNCSRLYVLQFRKSLGVVAILFSEPPPSAMVQSILASLNWSPPGSWRRWSCYDITFETPPNYTLHKAIFNPGRFHFTFTLGPKKFIFDRLVPANVVLDTTNLVSWCRQNQLYGAAKSTTILPVSDTEVDIFVKPSILFRAFPLLPGRGLPIRAKIRHVLEENKILVVAEVGSDMKNTNYQRVLASYATTTSV